MQLDIRYLPAVVPGCYVDCGLFWEQHEWPFIINATGTTWWIDVVYVNRFFFLSFLVFFVLLLHLVQVSSPEIWLDALVTEKSKRRAAHYNDACLLLSGDNHGFAAQGLTQGQSVKVRGKALWGSPAIMSVFTGLPCSILLARNAT